MSTVNMYIQHVHLCYDTCMYIMLKITAFDSLIKDIDRCTGIAKCRDIINRLDYLHDEQVHCEYIYSMHDIVHVHV